MLFLHTVLLLLVVAVVLLLLLFFCDFVMTLRQKAETKISTESEQKLDDVEAWTITCETLKYCSKSQESRINGNVENASHLVGITTGGVVCLSGARSSC